MAVLSISNHFPTIFLLIFLLKTSLAASNSSTFDTNIALYGDAEVVHGGYAVQLTSSVSWSVGRAMYKKPIKLTEGKPQKAVSFSANFSFSMSNGNGDGFAFVVVPKGFNLSMFGNGNRNPFGLLQEYGKSKFKVVAVKFNVLRDGKVHVGIDVGSNVTNVSTKNKAVRSGNKTYAWIDYEAGSNRLEVRVSKPGNAKPVDPLVWYPIDLSKMWGLHEEVFVGLSAMNRNSSQTCDVYSWSFEQRHVPQWMHSEPLDPKAVAKSTKALTVEAKKDCAKRAFAAMIFGVACGALVSFLGLYLWTVFGNRRPVVPEEFAEQPKEFEYEKMKVLVDNKVIEDGKQ